MLTRLWNIVGLSLTLCGCVKLTPKKGLELGDTYRNDMSCKQFIIAIAEVTRAEIESDLQQAQFVSVMSDGSTDISVVENEIVYIHFCTRGVTKCYFLGLMACQTANAQGIFNAIMKSLSFASVDRDELLAKMVAFVGDGASVNTGEINGVIALFRKHVNASVIMVKCMSHRVELALKSAMKTSPLFNKVHDLFDQLFKFYHKSPKQTSGLKQAFEALNMSSSQPIRVGGTRWVSHTLDALKNMLKGYSAFIMHLSQVINERLQINIHFVSPILVILHYNFNWIILLFQKSWHFDICVSW